MTRPRRARDRAWPQTLSGVLAGGLVALAVALVATRVVATQLGVPGPPVPFLVWHGLAAVAAVVLQVRADRARSPAASAAVAGVAALVLGALWFV